MALGRNRSMTPHRRTKRKSRRLSPAASAPPEPAKAEAPATVERPKPLITSVPAAPAAPPPPHKTEVKTLVRKSESASAPSNTASALTPERGGDGATAEELRRTKSSPLVRKIA